MMHEVKQYAARDMAEAVKAKRRLSANSPEHAYEQGRADVARIVWAIIKHEEAIDKDGETMYAPEASR